jgi:hypothetical protein
MTKAKSAVLLTSTLFAGIIIGACGHNEPSSATPAAPASSPSVNTDVAPAVSPAYTAPDTTPDAMPNDALDTTPQPAAVTTGTHVVYEITDARSAGTVTYSSGQGGSIGQEQSQHLPWHKEFDVDSGSLFVPTLSAQNSGSGAITCKITVDGQVVAQVTSHGAYAIASCTGNAIE